jgi:hypothetical protein
MVAMVGQLSGGPQTETIRQIAFTRGLGLDRERFHQAQGFIGLSSQNGEIDWYV